MYTPLNISRFSKLLASHPSDSFRSYVTSGLTEGFAIGFDGPRESVTAPNLPSSLAYTDHISTYLAKCCDMNQTAGPFDTQPFRTMMCSGLGVVPKRNGGLRVIHHLSAPPDLSVNDHIDPAAFSLKYIHVDDAVRAILNIGSGALLSKFDIRNAFRLIPVRPDDWPLLGIHWRNQYYFDKVLPFGLRSSPFIFDKVASAIEWIVRAHFKVPTLFHYLDDFLAVAPPSLSWQPNNTLSSRMPSNTLRFLWQRRNWKALPHH